MEVVEKKKLVPQLRFGEFEGDWTNSNLMAVSKEVSYGMNAAATKFDGKHKYLRITDIDEESRTFKPNPLTSPEGYIDEKFKLKENDIVFTRTGASVGKGYLYNPLDGNLFYAGFLIKFNICNANAKFVYALTCRSSYDRWVKVFSVRSGQPGLNAEEYKNFKFHIPTLLEQQKIAAFLSAVDEKIQQLRQKKALLEKYKKGVMQKLFPKKAGEAPELRFTQPNGSNYPDWQEKKLGEVAKITTGSTPSTKVEEYYNGNRLFVSPADIDSNRVITSTKTTLTEEGHLKGREIKKGGVLFVSIGSTIGKVAIAGEDCTTNQQINSLEAIEGNVNDFIFEVLYQKGKFIKTLAGVQAVPLINKSDFSNLKFSFPSKEEQQKIADFLSGIDQKINQVETQINQTQTFKKGLLQQMFV